MRPLSRLTSSSLAVLVGFGTSACTELAGASGSRPMAQEERRFTVTESTQLTLSNFDGAIDVRGWDRNEVLVRVEKFAPSEEWAQDIEFTAEQQGNRITVEVRKPRIMPLFGWQLHARLVVSTPRQSTVVANCRDGSIVAADLTGPLDLRSDDGSIRGHDLSGGLKALTADGSIRLERLSGDVALETSDGSIVIDGQFSGLRAHSNDGSVRVRAASGSATESDWDLSTGDGSVVLEIPEGFGGELDARTNDGRVRVNDVTVSNITGSIERGRVRGRLGAGGRAVRLRSGDGSIVIRRS